MSLYDRYLGLRIRRHHADPPAHIALVITERDILYQGSYDTLKQFCTWALNYGASLVTIAVSVLDEAVIPTLKQQLKNIDFPEALAVRSPEDIDPLDAPIRVSIGMGGRQEFADAVRELADDVNSGALSLQDIDEKAISDRLILADEPDLLIKTGAERLSDFAIWQSVYSELYFCDVNWHDFRKRDLLRAILDFQDRQRRFGK